MSTQANAVVFDVHAFDNHIKMHEYESTLLKY